MCVCVDMLSFQSGELNVVKFDEDHFGGYFKHFSFFALVELPPQN